MFRPLHSSKGALSFLARRGNFLSSHSRRTFSKMTQDFTSTPMEDAIRAKLTNSFQPVILEVHNDSHKHAHHKPMQGVKSRETHFRVHIVSDAFKSKPLPTRHRLIYALLKDEMQAEEGIHALQLTTRTRDEEDKARQKEGQSVEQ